MSTAATGTRAPALRRRLCGILAAALVAFFLASIAGFYHPATGFTVLIGFGGDHEYEVPAMARAPHAHLGAGYDGQFYAQIALVPLLRDPAIDRALDNPPYRARRILLSWIAYAAGLGHPWWVLQAYALENVVAWLVMAWVLTRWVPPTAPRGLALWTGCLFGPGLLASVRLALTDGPSTLLLACAAAAIECGRTWTTAIVVGVSGLARETNLFAMTLFPRPRGWRQAALLALAVVLAALPLLLWQDYLFSIYRRAAFAKQNQLAMPLSGFLYKWKVTLAAFAGDAGAPHLLALAATLALTVQAAFLFVYARAFAATAWWRLGFPYAVLMFLLDFVVWGGYPGAAARVLLPMTVAFNVLLARIDGPSFWAWFCGGNAALIFAPSILRS